MTYTSIKIKQRKSVVSNRRVPLYMQLIRHRKMKRIPLDLYVYPEEWEPDKQIAVIPPGTERTQSEYLLRINEVIEQARQTVGQIIGQLEKKGDFTVDDIIASYTKKISSAHLPAYIDKLVRELTEQQRHATSRHYRSLQNSFNNFLSQQGSNRQDITLSAINKAKIIEYEKYLNAQGLAPNTVSFYLRTLRAIRNKAVAAGLVEDEPGLFKQVNTRIEKTQKRAVKEETIKDLEALTDEKLETPNLALARDLFLFSYYTRGMAFIDIVHLTKDNIRGDMLVYTRRKTGQELQIKLIPKIRALIEKYYLEDFPYLFPIIKQSASEEYKNYESALRTQNLRLKKIGESIGCYLSTYIPRHTWASVAKSKGIPEELISEGMGHTSLKTTRIYIATLDNTRLDRMNEFVISGTCKENYLTGNSVSW